jgi:hypothetical protein
MFILTSFEVVIQCNRIESRVITGEALPLPLQLDPVIIWLQILSNQAMEQLYQLYPYNYYFNLYDYSVQNKSKASSPGGMQ